MTATSPRPVVRTYRGGGEAGPPRLTGLPGVQRAEVRPARALELERHDTDDHRLAAAGTALDLRRDDDGVRWELALPGGDRVRRPVGDEPLPAVPEELDRLVRGDAGARAVRPVGRVRTVRTTTVLHDGAGAVVGEVVHDLVTLATLGRTTRVESWHELEVRGANDALADAVAERADEAGLRPAGRGAEAELARLLRPTRPRTRPVADGSAGAALLEHLATHVDRLAAEELRVRRGEHDSVHQMRVASRRLRSALQVYRPLLDRSRTDPLVDGLRELGRVLAPARDAEVLHERIADGLRSLPPEQLLGPAQAQVERHFGRAEAEARAAVLAELDGERHARLRADLDALVEHPPLTPRAARPARKELRPLVGRAARRLARAVEAAVEHGGRDEAAVHTARKAGKRLRYATEVAGERKLATSLKAFQAALGEHQDVVVARSALRELGARAENGFSFGILLGRDAARAAEIERELPRLWAGAWTPKVRRRLR